MDTCRTCMRQEFSGRCFELFAVDVQPNVKLLTNNTALTIAPGDGLPAHICCDCFAKLAAFQSLCVQAVESDRVFRYDSVVKSEQLVSTGFDKIDASALHGSGYIKNDNASGSLASDLPDVKQEAHQQNIDSNPRQIDDDDDDDSDNDADDDANDGDNHFSQDQQHSAGEDASSECKPNVQQASKAHVAFPARPKKAGRPTVANKSEKYTCDMCGKWYRNKSLLAGHLRQHLGLVPFACDDCPKQFKKHANLLNHIGRRHTEDQPTECPHEGCGKMYRLPHLARDHFERIHLGRKKRILVENICDVCGKSCSTRTSLHQHKKQHMDVKEYPFGCEVCGKRFLAKNGWHLHMLRHQNIRNFPCPLCPSRMVSHLELKAHLANHDRSVKWPCPECTMVFNRKPSLRAHELATHRNLRQFVCRFCSQGFNREITLINHERLHTGERPFACTHCDRAYVKRSLLNEHVKKHHS